MITFAALWDGIKLLGIWKRIGAAWSWVFASRDRLLAALCCLIAVWGVVQHRGKIAAQADLTACTQARKADHEKAADDLAKAQSDYRSKAHAAQLSIDAARAGAGARDTAYAATHSLPRTATPPAGHPEGGNPAIPALSPADTVLAEIDRVWITRADWRTCDANFDYAEAAHRWASSLDAPKGY